MDIHAYRDILVRLYEAAKDDKKKAFLLYKLQQLDASKRAPSLYHYMSDNSAETNRFSPDSGIVYPKDYPRTRMMMIEPNKMKTWDEDMVIDDPDPYTGFNI